MNNAQKHIKAKEQITKALKALEEASELVADTHEYNTSSDIFHASTVKAYNDIVTASIILNEVQTI
jgi:hypothetical protein